MKNANNFLGCWLIFLIFGYVTTYLHAINTQLFPEMGPITLIILHSTGTVSKDVHAVLGVKIGHRHDYTSCATLGHFEVEF